MEDVAHKGQQAERKVGQRSLYPLDRIEEYSSCHPETVEELLDWHWEKFEAAWSSYKLRSEFDRLEQDQRSLTSALYSSGSGGKELKEAIENLTVSFDNQRERIIEFYQGENGDEINADDEPEFLMEKWW